MKKLLVIQYIGFFLILGGGLLVSLKKNGFNKFQVSKALLLMLVAGILLDVYYILEKYVYLNQPFWNGFLWIRLGSFIGAFSILLVPRFRKSFIMLKDNIKGKAGIMILSGETLNLIALVSIGYALSKGAVSLVTSLTNFQPLFLLIFVVILSHFFPKLYKEQMNKKLIFRKFIAVGLLVVGLLLITQ